MSGNKIDPQQKYILIVAMSKLWKATLCCNDRRKYSHFFFLDFEVQMVVAETRQVSWTFGPNLQICGIRTAGLLQ